MSKMYELRYRYHTTLVFLDAWSERVTHLLIHLIAKELSSPIELLVREQVSNSNSWVKEADYFLLIQRFRNFDQSDY